MTPREPSVHELPELPERSGLGERLVRHAVALALGAVVLLVTGFFVVLAIVPDEPVAIFDLLPRALESAADNRGDGP